MRGGEHYRRMAHVIASKSGAILYFLNEGLKVFRKGDGAREKIDGSGDRASIVDSIG